MKSRIEAKKEKARSYLKKLQVRVRNCRKIIIDSREEDIGKFKKYFEWLRESESRYKSVVENTLDFIYLIDSKFRVISANTAARKVISKRYKNIIGRRVDEIFPKKVAQGYIQSIKKVIKSGKPLAIRGSRMIIGKHVSWLSVTLSPVKDLNGKVIRVIGISHDITSEIKKEEIILQQRRNYEVIFNSSPNMIFTKDLKGRVVTANNTFANFHNLSKDKIIGKDTYDLVRPRVYAETMFKDDLEVIRTGKPKLAVERLMRSPYSNKEITGLVSKLPFYDYNGKTVGTLNFIVDITERKKMDQVKNHFVSLTSHQLRTPTTAIRWYSEMLLGGECGSLSEKQINYVNEIYHGNQRMIYLINMFLNISQIEMGTLKSNLKLINLTQVADDVLTELQVQIASKKIKLERKYKDFFFKGDKKLIRIILQNLLSNAVDYTPPIRGKIVLAIKKIKNGILIEVEDNGCGIPKEAQEKIFTEFFRADNACNIKADGSGLGLFLTKSIIESLGGTIDFKSTEGKGTTFRVNIFGRCMTKRRNSKSK